MPSTSQNTLSLTGLLHDFGKYSIKFQRFIHEEWRRAKEGIESKRQSGIDHGVYGAKYIYDLSGKYGVNEKVVGELLANVICYHHGGLPDAEDFNGNSPLLMRLQDENRLADYEQVKEAFFKDLQITTIENAASFIWEKKAQVNSLLVVVNKIKTAKDLFRYLQKNKEDVESADTDMKNVLNENTRLFLLTGDQCPEHKKDVLDELLKALKKGEQVLCVSTSLMEAGVDISFEAAIRNMTKLDSIVQTAGRVNRNGERDMGYCYVINLEEGSYEHMSEIRLGQK